MRVSQVRIPLPFGTTKADVDVQIEAAFLRVAVTGKPQMGGALSTSSPARLQHPAPPNIDERFDSLAPAGRLITEDCSWSFSPPGHDDEQPQLQLDLMKRKVPDGELWGYILAAERDAASGFSDEMDDPNF